MGMLLVCCSGVQQFVSKHTLHAARIQRLRLFNEARVLDQAVVGELEGLDQNEALVEDECLEIGRNYDVKLPKKQEAWVSFGSKKVVGV